MKAKEFDKRFDRGEDNGVMNLRKAFEVTGEGPDSPGSEGNPEKMCSQTRFPRR